MWVKADAGVVESSARAAMGFVGVDAQVQKQELEDSTLVLRMTLWTKVDADLPSLKGAVVPKGVTPPLQQKRRGCDVEHHLSWTIHPGRELPRRGDLRQVPPTELEELVRFGARRMATHGDAWPVAHGVHGVRRLAEQPYFQLVQDILLDDDTLLEMYVDTFTGDGNKTLSA